MANGAVPAIPEAGVQAEIGTAVDRDRIFLWDDLRVSSPADVRPAQIDEMLRLDGKARSLEQALTLPLRQAPFSIDAIDGDKGEADFIRSALTRPANAGGMSTPLELVIAQAVSACLYRRSFFEKVLRLEDDGATVYDKLAFRPAATCRLSFDERSGSFAGFRQRVPDGHKGRDEQGYVTIPPNRAFVFVYGQHRRPIEGVSDLETAYKLYEAKQKVRFLWFVFLENQTMPKAIAKHDSNDPAEVQKFARKVATLKGGGVVGISKDQEVAPYETSNAAGQAFSDAIRFLDSEMSASVLAGFTDLAGAASSGRGSYALSADQSDLFLQSRQAVLVELAAALVSYLIADLCTYNFPDPKVPRFKFGPLLQEHADKALEMLQTLAGQPVPLVPREFLDMLVEKVAAYLGLDSDRVAKALRRAQEQAPEDPASQLAAGIGAAQQMLAQLPAAA